MSSSTGTVVFNESRIKAKGVIATESIGVGTSNPTSNLHVSGNAYVTSNLEVGTANLFVDTTTGRVGVGTDSPGNKLHIQGDSAVVTSDPSVNNYGQIEISSSSYAGWTNADRPTNLKIGIDHTVGTLGAGFIQGVIDYIQAGVPLLLCPGGGNVGIGTTNPSAKLHVHGGDIFAPGIVQVQSSTFTGTLNGNLTGTSLAFTTISGLTTSITPKRSNSKILVLLNLFWSGGSDAYFQGNVKRGTSVLVKHDGVGSASATSFGMLNYDRPEYFLGNIGFSYLDTANTTNAITYSVEVRNRGLATTSGGHAWYINYTSSTNDANRLTGVSTLTLIEIQQ